MTDALCGPSNPLQSFQKHASTDRSLQQDRLAFRNAHQSQQGFRSQAAGNAGFLDPEFEAFQAGASIAPDARLDFRHGLPAQQQHQQPPLALQQQAPGGWASDFAQMHISSPPPSAAATTMVRAPPSTNSWQHDFAAQFSQSQNSASPSLAMQQSSYGPTMSGYGYQQPMGYMPAQSSQFSTEQQSSEARWKGKGRWQQEETYDKDAFEREFEAMASETLRSDATTEQFVGMDETNQALNVPITESDYAAGMEPEVQLEWVRRPSPTAEAAARRERDQAAVRAMHADAENQPLDERSRAETDEDLARTAGVLLEQVSSETSEKFAQSNFLALMRQFRDREKRIDGNQVVDADAESSQTAGGGAGTGQDADLTRNGPTEYSMTGALDPPSYKSGKSGCEYPTS